MSAKYYAYLRISKDTQDLDNQKLGLLEYANNKGFAPLIIEEEIASRSKDWRKRKIAEIISEANPGDVLLIPEFSRAAGSALQVLEILQFANKKGLIVHVTKQNLIMDNSLQSEIMATVLGLAAQIERHFIQTRTKESLQAAKARGVKLGRPKGSKNNELKLDAHKEEVQIYVNMGLSLKKSAELLQVTPKTYAAYLKKRNIKQTNHKPMDLIKKSQRQY